MTGTAYDGVTVIYALRDPLTDRIRYVGQARDPWARLMAHIAAALSGHRPENPEKDDWLATLFCRHGLAPIVEMLEFVRGKPFAREKAWIAEFTAAGEPLLNRDNTAWARSIAGRARIAEASRTRVHSPEERAKRGASLRAYHERKRREA